MLSGLDLKGKPVAVFGLGDAVGYSEYFCDAMDEIYTTFKATGAKMIGHWPAEGYEHEGSKVRHCCDIPLQPQPCHLQHWRYLWYAYWARLCSVYIDHVTCGMTRACVSCQAHAPPGLTVLLGYIYLQTLMLFWLCHCSPYNAHLGHCMALCYGNSVLAGASVVTHCSLAERYHWMLMVC